MSVVWKRSEGEVSWPFFRHGCDIFEDAILNGNKRAKRMPNNKYACTGGHQADGGCPTTLRKAYRPIEGDSDKNEEDEVEPTTDKKRVATTTKTSCISREEKASPVARGSPVKKKMRQTQVPVLLVLVILPRVVIYCLKRR